MCTNNDKSLEYYEDMHHFMTRILEYLDNSLFISIDTKRKRIDTYDFESYPELLAIYNDVKNFAEDDIEFIHIFYSKLYFLYNQNEKRIREKTNLKHKIMSFFC